MEESTSSITHTSVSRSTKYSRVKAFQDWTLVFDVEACPYPGKSTKYHESLMRKWLMHRVLPEEWRGRRICSRTVGGRLWRAGYGVAPAAKPSRLGEEAGIPAPPHITPAAPGVLDTMAREACLVSMFMSDDLPTFDLPITANSGRSVRGHCATVTLLFTNRAVLTLA